MTTWFFEAATYFLLGACLLVITGAAFMLLGYLIAFTLGILGWGDRAVVVSTRDWYEVEEEKQRERLERVMSHRR